jgi:hypothetical protein
MRGIGRPRGHNELTTTSAGDVISIRNQTFVIVSPPSKAGNPDTFPRHAIPHPDATTHLEISPDEKSVLVISDGTCYVVSLSSPGRRSEFDAEPYLHISWSPFSGHIIRVTSSQIQLYDYASEIIVRDSFCQTISASRAGRWTAFWLTFSVLCVINRRSLSLFTPFVPPGAAVRIPKSEACGFDPLYFAELDNDHYSCDGVFGMPFMPCAFAFDFAADQDIVDLEWNRNRIFLAMEDNSVRIFELTNTPTLFATSTILSLLPIGSITVGNRLLSSGQSVWAIGETYFCDLSDGRIGELPSSGTVTGIGGNPAVLAMDSGRLIRSAIISMESSEFMLQRRNEQRNVPASSLLLSNSLGAR